MRAGPWLTVLLGGCIQNSLSTDEEEPVPTEETGFECPPQIPDCKDTGDAEDTEPPDSEPPEETCEDNYYPSQEIAQTEECITASTVGSFTPVVEWHYDTFSVSPASKSVMMQPIVASLTDDDGDGDIDQDDTPDILFVTYEGTSWTGAGVLRALNGDGSGEIFNITGSGVEGCSGLAAADIDGDGVVEIVGVTTQKRVIAWEHDGTQKWISGQHGGWTSWSAMPAISDMDGDGNPEIIVGALILESDGSLRGVGAEGQGSPGTYGTTSFAVDLDGDGTQEVVTGNAAYDPDGKTLWSNGLSDGYVAVADFDADGEGEIVVSGRGFVRLLETDGSLQWEKPIPNAQSAYGGPPTIADFDGDGEPEIGVAANSSYTVYNADGSQLWQKTSQDSSSGVTGSSVFDFEGDGEAEAVYADETRLWGFAGPTGSQKLSSTSHSSWTVVEYPVIVDVDADDNAEIVVGHNIHPSYGSNARYGISVIGDQDDSWQRGRRIWNQYAYHITNVEDDGTVPKKAKQNWDSYNNFRSGDLTAATGGAFPDLVVQIDEVCEVFCEEGRLLVWGRVGNAGHVDVETAVQVVLWAVTDEGDKPLASQTVTLPIRGGELLAQMEFEITGLTDWAIQDLYLAVDGGNATLGDHEECLEENNEGRFGGPVCLD